MAGRKGTERNEAEKEGKVKAKSERVGQSDAWAEMKLVLAVREPLESADSRKLDDGSAQLGSHLADCAAPASDILGPLEA